MNSEVLLEQARRVIDEGDMKGCVILQLTFGHLICVGRTLAANT